MAASLLYLGVATPPAGHRIVYWYCSQCWAFTLAHYSQILVTLLVTHYQTQYSHYRVITPHQRLLKNRIYIEQHLWPTCSSSHRCQTLPPHTPAISKDRKLDSSNIPERFHIKVPKEGPNYSHGHKITPGNVPPPSQPQRMKVCA